jgi:uncharacterized protein (DUF488 family)
MKPDIVTIGVYGFDEEGFFHALQEARVDTFCDVRRRRGLRGSEYAFANSKRLQARLKELGIRYIHRKDLSPSNELRQRQNAADEASKTKKRQRSHLSPSFVKGYRQEVLNEFDSEQFLHDLEAEARVVALFCVERDPTACHRSLLAARLEEELGITVTHLTPLS